MRTSVNSDKLRTLFEAHRDRNEQAFERAAASIISEELAANHHVSATQLRRALDGAGNTDPKGSAARAEMRLMPKDRREGDDLLWIRESSVSPDLVTLAPATAHMVERVLREYAKRKQLLSHGLRPKSKLLFWGPPGTGKTLTAYLLAHELSLPVGVIRLSALISSFLGDTASHLQRVFSRAASAPMVLLLDEADALGKDRDDPNDVGELKRVVNSLLQAIDAFQPPDSLMIAASNHQYLLDPALWRRFDGVIPFPLPEQEQRQRFLKRLLSGVRFSGSVNVLASQMEQLSYADIERVVVEALKTMILDDRESLAVGDIAAELRSWRRGVVDAQKRPRRRK